MLVDTLKDFANRRIYVFNEKRSSVTSNGFESHGRESENFVHHRDSKSFNYFGQFPSWHDTSVEMKVLINVCPRVSSFATISSVLFQ